MADADSRERASQFVPLSVRHGNRRTRAAWKLKGAKERFALWLCPWLRSAVENARGPVVDGASAERLAAERSVQGVDR